MIFTVKTNDFLITNLDSTQLIIMPSRFTSTEAKFLKELLLETTKSCKSVNSDSFNSFIKKIVIDFEKTTFMNNDGLIGLCQIFQIAKREKIDLIFKSFSPQVKMILSLSGLEDIFSIAKGKNLSTLS